MHILGSSVPGRGTARAKARSRHTSTEACGRRRECTVTEQWWRLIGRLVCRGLSVSCSKAAIAKLHTALGLRQL